MAQQQQLVAPVLTPEQIYQLTQQVGPLTQRYACINCDMKVLAKEQKAVKKQLDDIFSLLQKSHIRNIEADVQVIEEDTVNQRAHVVRKRKGFSMTQVVSHKKVSFNKEYVAEVLKEYCNLRQLPLNIPDLTNFLWDAKNRTVANKTNTSLRLKEDATCSLQPGQVMDLHQPMNM